MTFLLGGNYESRVDAMLFLSKTITSRSVQFRGDINYFSQTISKQGELMVCTIVYLLILLETMFLFKATDIDQSRFFIIRRPCYNNLFYLYFTTYFKFDSNKHMNLLFICKRKSS